MKIYIASSWRNQHAVEMLTITLRSDGYEVISFVEQGESFSNVNMPFEEWVQTKSADVAFEHGVNAAKSCDVLIYIGPSGVDAWAEVGVASEAGAYVIGLWAKGEKSGLMRKLMDVWCDNYRSVVSEIHKINNRYCQ